MTDHRSWNAALDAAADYKFLRLLIEEQSEGEWTDEQIDADVSDFQNAILALRLPEDAPGATLSKMEKVQPALTTTGPSVAEAARVDSMGLREFARAASLSTTTAYRIKNGHPNTSLGNLKKALPFLARCPCCDRALASDKGAV